MGKQSVQYTSLAKAFADIYGPVSIIGASRLTGGDINKAYLVQLSNGSNVFMKANAFENADFFAAEAAGLASLASSGTIGIPKVLAAGTDPGEEAGYSFLLLEYLTPSGKIPGYWQTFARELAALHRADCSSFTHGGRYGYSRDNYIGATPQDNTQEQSWIAFFRDHRLFPQVQKAAHYFDDAFKADMTKLLDHLDEFLIEPEHPSLLHGDLWSGNILGGPDGKAWLIDPACYCGHCEVDLAMTRLFGGVPEEFYEAYRECTPLEPGYAKRFDLYNLYQLLNHLNLFGTGYLTPVMEITRSFVS